MSDTLAKLTPPRVRDIFIRERLFEKLDAVREQARAIWINAPAGSGKTTLVASYLLARNIKPIWYQVDEGDRDLSTFYYYLGKAARQYSPKNGDLPLLTPEYQQGVSAFTRYFFRELYGLLKKTDVLVFDNSQDIGGDAELNSLFSIICDELPAEGQLIVISRNRFPPSLARHHLSGHLIEMDWEDIQLTRTESEGFAEKVLGQIPQQQLDILYHYTSGWTTGLILYLKQLQTGESGIDNIEFTAKINSSYTEYQESMFDYFTNELFNRLDPELQDFLTRVVWLPTMSIDSANALAGSESAKTILKQLEKENFFLSRKSSLNLTYEFHPLFRKFLTTKSQDRWSADQIRLIKLKAAEEAVASGDIDEAAKLYIELDRKDELIQLLLRFAEQMIEQGRHKLLFQWMSEIPATLFEHNGKLLYWRGATKLFFNPFESYDDLAAAYHMFEKQNEVQWMMLCWFGISEAIFMKHDGFADAGVWMARLHKLLSENSEKLPEQLKQKVILYAFNLSQFSDPGTEQFESWLNKMEYLYANLEDPDAKSIAGTRLAFYYVFYGKLDRLQALSRDLGKLERGQGVRPVIRILCLWTVATASWMSGLQDENEQYIKQSIELGKEYGVRLTELWVFSAAIFSSLVFNKMQDAENYLEQYRTMGSAKQRFYLSHYLYLQAWYDAQAGKYTQAQEKIKKSYDLIIDLNIIYSELLHQLGLATNLILLESYDEAYEHIQQIYHKSIKIKNPHFYQYRYNMLLSWYWIRRGEKEKARTTLQKAWEYGQETGNIAGGWWLTEMLVELSEFSLNENIETEYTRYLIRTYNLHPANTDAVHDIWPYPIKVYTLGRFSLLIDEVSVTAARKAPKKMLELLKALIALGGKDVSGHNLTELLWPDHEGDDGYNTFTTTLHRLRKFLGHHAIVYSDGRLTLDPKVCWVDIWGVERNLNNLLELPETDLSTKGNELLQSILKQYQGQFLRGEEDTGWSISTQARLHQKVISAINRVCKQLEQGRQTESALEICQQALEVDDLHEGFYQGVMRCCAQLGRAADGMAAYQRCRTTLHKRLNVSPSPQTETLRAKLQGAAL